MLYQRLARPIKATDWPRFQTYASRIHHFAESDVPYGEIKYSGPQYIQALVHAKPSDIATFCPHMRSVNWKCFGQLSDKTIQYMPVFMSPATTKATIPLGSLMANDFSLARSLLSNFPSIWHIEIQRGSMQQNPEAETALSTLLSHGAALRNVRIDGLVPQAIVRHLAGLEHLKRLTVHIDNDTLPTQSSGFRNLKYLQVTSQTFAATSNFLRILTSPLKIVRFRLSRGLLRPQELAHTFEMMKQHCLHPDLQTLVIFMHYSYLEPPFACIDNDVLRPLLVFSNLSHIELYFTAPMNISNEFVREMASAWPRLSKLVLNTEGWFQKSNITPAGLIPLLCLPNLSAMSIAINASVIDSPAEPPVSGTGTGALRDLILQDSVINTDGIEPMAAFLSRFAPNLKEVQSWNMAIILNAGISPADGKVYQERWKEIARRVPALVAAREQERPIVAAD